MIVANYETGKVLFGRGRRNFICWWARRPYPDLFPGKKPLVSYIVAWRFGIERGEYRYPYEDDRLFRWFVEPTLDRQRHRLGIWFFGGVVGIEGPLMDAPTKNWPDRKIWHSKRLRLWPVNPPPKPFTHEERKQEADLLCRRGRESPGP